MEDNENTQGKGKRLLSDVAASRYAKAKERKREAYRYARELGFKPYEAQILAGWSKNKIKQLAKEREA